ncbi:phosphate transport system permease protein [Amaricoccus macauensis]|uniref:Phosphate transport system permease protein n=1 Tax=Amaricoccus macauensis TaxID=57001 RepID=A0A840SMB7_9RHOB|nr:phosphate ABC transporter permease subunit PstC [Amaricoccus macauensis]MBB5220491.1 phosphate transport system permease protein [Amaricoccus macauensis]
MPGSLILSTLLFAAAAFFLGRAAARPFGTGARSRPVYHGALLALWVALPGLAVTVAWALAQPALLDRLLLAGLPAGSVDAIGTGGRALVLAQIHALAEGRALPHLDAVIVEAGARLSRWREIGRLALFATVAATLLVSFLVARTRITPRLHARAAVERALTVGLVVCASVALLTTVALLVALLRETVEFFRLVPPAEFLFGTNWDPQVAFRSDQIAGTGAFGAASVFAGTLLVAAIAMAVAVPLGLLIAIHLVEYARPGTRAWAKPALEILAGVPTVAYFFAALLAVAPAIQHAGRALGLVVSPNSALAVGLVTGIMILPLVSSLADDALRAVPQDLRQASLAVGATRAETVLHVLLPAAMPGILGGVLLALSRAVGETMIVLMAAGLVATISLDPLGTTTTVTVQIATLLAVDAPFDDPRTLAAYALGLTLFVVTFGLNLLALRLVRRASRTDAS